MMPLYFRRLRSKITYRARKNRIFSKIVTFFIFMIVIIGLIFYNSNFKPVLAQLSISKASSIGQLVINNAVERIMKKDEIVQNKLIIFEKDENGQICAVTPDLGVVNHLKSELAIIIQENLYSIDNSKVYIPLGNLTGIEVLSNQGPSIPVNLIPLGKAAVDFKSTFTKAGINQTRLQIAVTVALDVTLLLPNNNSTATRVETTIPLSETIIVGSVPESYTNIESSDEKIRDDLVHISD